jgi:hypothetical protein
MPTAISTDFNNGDLLSKFISSGVSFLLVGGAAVAFYGCREETHLSELDILIDPALQNAERVIAVLSAVGMQIRIGAGELAGPKKQLPVKQLLFDMDILTPAADENFSAMLARSAQGTVNGGVVRVIARDDLIAMKRVAANDATTDVEKHKRDLDCLTRHECPP